MKNIFIKIIKYFFIVLFSLAVFIYISLNICVNSKAVKVAPEIINNEATISLTDEQIFIISYLYENKKSKNFDKLPLITDVIFEKNYIAFLTAHLFCSNNSVTTMEWRFKVIGTQRLIEKKVNYIDCCNYLFSKIYYGNEIYGLNNAANFYFNKEYTDLTQEEFIKLMITTINPARYDILKNNQIIDEKIKEVQNKLENSQL